MTPLDSSQERRGTAFQIGFSLLAALIIAFGKVSYTDSDAMGSLLSSKAILLDGSLRLDRFIHENNAICAWGIHQRLGHYYYYFPLGSSLLALPVVLLCELYGIDIEARDHSIQILLSSLTTFGIVSLLIQVARQFLSLRAAIASSLVFWAGTALSSTLGTAYWSHDAATLFALLAIFGALFRSQHKVSFIPIATALFMAYLSRPTMALLSAPVILFMFGQSPANAVKTGLLLALYAVIFIFFSMTEWGQPLPDYYLPSRLESDTFWTALYGNLLSPSRGLFTFSPVILASIFLFKENHPWAARNQTWKLIAIAWPFVHLLVISRFPHWYGGHCYGARLMTDVLPGIFVLYILHWPKQTEKVWRMALLGLAIVFSIWANLIQGVFNKETRVWNTGPDISLFDDHLLDWSYPQFAANRKENLMRRAKKQSESKILKHAPQ